MPGDALPVLGPAVPHGGTWLSRALGRVVLRLLRFHVAGAFPDVPRCVMIAAPHTSNWDFLAGIAAKFALGLRVEWLGKHSLFRGPAGRALRWMGGIPVDRSRAAAVVEEMAEAFARRDRLWLAVAPEGTRAHVDEWKSGFHRIARAAGVPILPVALDWGLRAVRILPLFVPSADYDADVTALRALFTPEMARNPAGY